MVQRIQTVKKSKDHNAKAPITTLAKTTGHPEIAALLNAPSTLALLYTPANEHFGIGPVESMACGLPVIACDSGGPTESVLDGATGWLRTPDPEIWADALVTCVGLEDGERRKIADAAKVRAGELFGMEAMAVHRRANARSFPGQILMVV